MQKLSHPRAMLTKAFRPPPRSIGASSVKSGGIGAVSTTRPSSISSSSVGSLAMFWVPNTRSTDFCRFAIASPSRVAKQPHTPILRSGLDLLSLLRRPIWLNTLLLRLVADRAGVQQNQIGTLARFGLLVPLLLQIPRDRLRIVAVHLAAVCEYPEFPAQGALPIVPNQQDFPPPSDRRPAQSIKAFFDRARRGLLHPIPAAGIHKAHGRDRRFHSRRHIARLRFRCQLAGWKRQADFAIDDPGLARSFS